MPEITYEQSKKPSAIQFRKKVNYSHNIGKENRLIPFKVYCRIENLEYH